MFDALSNPESPPPLKGRSLVIGVGSPFGADVIGLQAAARLSDAFGQHVDVVASDRPGAALLAQLRGYGCAVIVDALHGDRVPGSLHVLDREALQQDSGTSSHGFGVADALALGHALGTLPQRLSVIGIAAGDGDSPPVVDWQELRALVARQLQLQT